MQYNYNKGVGWLFAIYRLCLAMLCFILGGLLQVLKVDRWHMENCVCISLCMISVYLRQISLCIIIK